jgi:MOSC domain-containing protein YiiM
MGDGNISKNEAIRELYNQCKDIDIEETMELVLNAKTQEKQEFFALISDFVLQKKQKETIKNKRF